MEKLEIPRYHPLAKAARIEGTIRVSVLLTEAGSVQDIKIEAESKYRQARSLFGAPVEDAIRHASFRTGCSAAAVNFTFHFVLATGGGAVIEEENRRALAERGVVVYLATSIDQQLERTRHARHRPLLNDTDPEHKLQELMQRRARLYTEIADFTVSTDGRRVQLVAEEIFHELKRAPVS